MKFWVNVGLFLSAYLPFFVILAIKNWYNQYVTIVFLIVALYSFVWFLIIWIIEKNTIECYKVVKAENKTKDSLSYLVPYIISFVGFDLTRWQDISALSILLLILFAVYVNSDLLYINPMLSFFKYRVYQVEVSKIAAGCDDSRWDITLLTKRGIKSDDVIRVWDVSDNVFLEVN
ncbi:hypothetical protein [Methanosphaerula palustris]|uniref:Uncharacterized protein n=1 Tax=Methanosphaerula palustris (strain ATCC BAA-1556 / DSM 19958 / E1-9c) TaxID=521011 RepID=B8GFF3_METPE|nr:hypothetical protein [Methanosphaerula palustris]ACL16001.1 conserved hypothetical protein [Methanosphaerula palustris E1-9c]